MKTTSVAKQLAWVLILLWGSAPSVSVAADATALDPQTRRVITKIRAVESGLRTFSAAFHQIQKSALFADIVRSEGTIYYAAGGKLKFRVLRPAPLAVVFDGDWLYIHDPEQAQTRKHHLGGQANILKKYFGVGQSLEELTRRFDIKATSNAPLPGVTLEMAPKQGRLAQQIKMISAVVDDNTWLPREIFIQQTQGDWARIVLDFTAVNQPLPPNAFDPEQKAHP